MELVTIADVRAAQDRVAGVAVRTPLIPAPWAPGPGELFVKPEMLQPIGAFKIRGAYNKIAGLTADERARGLVASSSGNHAQAVAYAARMFDAKATIVIPDTAPDHKVAATRALGAEVLLVPPAERDILPRQLVEERGYILVPPFDDGAIIAGQGTIGAEIADDLPDVDLVLVPVSGGGLISGIAAAVKALRPEARVVGVEPQLAADASESFRTGRRIAWHPEQTHRTIADGLRTVSVGVLPWEHIRAHVDDIVTVTEDEIRAAMRALVVQGRLVVEPSGAAATAAYLSIRDQLPESARTVAIASGGNADPAMLAEILSAG
ncbi:threonine ammonia-lyase [Phytoactinopolyspora halotolerans]|uniref:threonine ammonia-lyase n=1 Tax=Phytoactinopolyspora halotolerans TaxID=1981512 RepID=A0A6L9SE97_9ACTN|nr:threonine/serine dehydratase [Phytoactinopolyspora halotolerans]NEE02400.1 pyridoxal-phosphate dependent enzyme [Phytoactinopolyspora halotolerans]